MRFQWERVVRDCTLPPTTKLVALMLATYASGDGTHAHPGQDRLARECGLKPRAVRNHLDRLAKLGLIVRTFRGSSAGRGGRADVYRLNMPDWLPAAAAPADWTARTDGHPDHRHPRAGDRAGNTGTVVPNTGTQVPEHRHQRATHQAFTSPTTKRGRASATAPTPLTTENACKVSGHEGYLAHNCSACKQDRAGMGRPA